MWRYHRAVQCHISAEQQPRESGGGRKAPHWAVSVDSTAEGAKPEGKVPSRTAAEEDTVSRRELGASRDV